MPSPHLPLAAILALALVTPPTLHAESSVTAQDAFARLKTMTGTWTATNPEMAEDSVHEYQLSANGTVVMETMNPGTDHEMINMFHLDGDELVLTHYCAGGNQPTMRLDRATATAEEWRFDFTGGTNLDPETDPHIHNARFAFVDENHVTAWWTAKNEGQETPVEISLTRQRSE